MFYVVGNHTDKQVTCRGSDLVVKVFPHLVGREGQTKCCRSRTRIVYERLTFLPTIDVI